MVRQRRGPRKNYESEPEREEGTGKTQCHGAKEKGLQEKGSLSMC